jgi:hypothetical protein
MFARKSFLSPRIRDPRGDIASPEVNAGAKNPTGKSFMLTLERLREVLSYDPETGIWKWVVTHSRCRPAGSRAGSIKKKTGYRVIQIDGVGYQSTRLACFYMSGDWPSGDVDHRDRDRANDRWENLRPATRWQNHANRRLTDNLSGFKGVRLSPGSKKNPFRAQISLRGVTKHLGCYPTAEAAHAAYFKAAEKMFGEFARAA